jgi:hypothetical protein
MNPPVCTLKSFLSADLLMRISGIAPYAFVPFALVTAIHRSEDILPIIDMFIDIIGSVKALWSPEVARIVGFPSMASILLIFIDILASVGCGGLAGAPNSPYGDLIAAQ